MLGKLIGEIEQSVEVVAEQNLAGRSFHFGQAVERGGEVGAQLGHIDAGFLQQRTCGTALLVEQGRHQVHRLDVLIVATNGERLGIGQGRLEFGRQLVHSHKPPSRNARKPARKWGCDRAIQRLVPFLIQIRLACRPVWPSRRCEKYLAASEYVHSAPP